MGTTPIRAWTKKRYVNGGATLTWQHGRELGTYTDSDTAVSYTYNENGIRTSKTVNGVKTTYILDENDRLVGEVTGENVTAFLYDESGCVYGFLYNGVPYYYLFNGQGDVMRVVDADGAVVATYNYDAWGNPITATGTMASVNPIRYRGYYYDSETALYYLQSRYYDPTVSRFLNADDPCNTIGEKNVFAASLFVYCRNAPVFRADYNGCADCVLRKRSSAPEYIIRTIHPSLTSKPNSTIYWYDKENNTSKMKNGLHYITYTFKQYLSESYVRISEYTVIRGTVGNFEKLLREDLWWSSFYRSFEKFMTFVGLCEEGVVKVHGLTVSGASLGLAYDFGTIITDVYENWYWTNSKKVNYVRQHYPKRFYHNSIITIAWSVTNTSKREAWNMKPGPTYFNLVWHTRESQTYYAYD